MDLRVGFRDLAAEDLADLEWSGNPAHLRGVAEALTAAYTGRVELIVGALGNGRLVALGGVDYRPHPGAGLLWILIVRETLRSLGVGTALIGALEDRARRRGCRRVRLSVEHDNPPAARLYHRLGYRAVGTGLEWWPLDERRTYVTVTTVLERQL